jgi:hypothetical protein
MARERFVEPANAIVGEACACANRACTGLVTNHAQCQIVSLAVAEIAVVTDLHGLLLVLSFFDL